MFEIKSIQKEIRKKKMQTQIVKKIEKNEIKENDM